VSKNAIDGQTLLVKNKVVFVNDNNTKGTPKDDDA
jgi:hypothetical protein